MQRKIYTLLAATVMCSLLCGCRNASTNKIAKNADTNSKQSAPEATVVTSTYRPEDDTPAFDASEDEKKFGTPEDNTALTVNGSNRSDVCKSIVEYLAQHAPEYTGIPVEYDQSSTDEKAWKIIDLSKFASENSNYNHLERWTSEANDPNPSDMSKPYPYVTAMVENKDNEFIVHRLSVGSTVFFDDNHIPEDSLSKTE